MLQRAGSGQPAVQLSRNLKATALPPPAQRGYDAAQLVKAMLAARIPQADSELRQIYGANLNLTHIAWVLYRADCGSMRDLADLSTETLDADPHLAGILNKRFTAIQGIEESITPATGPGIDSEKARFYADVVRDQLAYLRNQSQIRRDVLWTIWNGYGVSEKYWSQVPNPQPTRYGPVRFVLADVAWIHNRRVHLGPMRELRIFDGSYSPTGFTEVGMDTRNYPGKFVSTKVRLWNEYPEREGLRRKCLHWSFFKRFGAKEQMILLELFAKPWRWLEVMEGLAVSPSGHDQAEEFLANLPGLQYGQLPAGFALKMFNGSSTTMPLETVDMADKQNSKIVLGQTGTTDAAAMGLGSSQSKVMLTEQLMINVADAVWLAEVFEDQITDEIIAVNFGPGEVTHAPRYRLPVALLSAKEELEVIQQALNMGLSVPLSRAHDAARLEQPQDDEPYIKQEVPPPDPFTGAPQPARPQVVYPKGMGRVPGELEAPPDPPRGGSTPGGNPSPAPAGPEGGAPPVPSPADDLDVAADDGPIPSPGDEASLQKARALATRMTELGVERCEHMRNNRCRLCGIERERDFELDDSGNVVWKVVWRAIGDAVEPQSSEPPASYVPTGGIWSGKPRRPAITATVVPMSVPITNYDATGAVVPTLFHAGPAVIAQLGDEAFFDGWYGWGFYAAFGAEYVRHWYGPKVTKFSVKPEARVLVASISPQLAPPGLFDLVIENDRAAWGGDEARAAELRAMMTENPIQWVHGVDRLAIEKGYDLIVYSDEQVVVKNADSLVVEGEQTPPEENVSAGVRYSGILRAAIPGATVGQFAVRTEGGRHVVYSGDGERLSSCATEAHATGLIYQVGAVAAATAAMRSIDRIVAELDAVDADRVIAAVRATARGDLIPLGDRVHENVLLVRQPESVNGSPEVIVDRFVDEVAGLTEELGLEIVRAGRDKTRARDIGRALNKAHRGLNLDRLEAAIYRRSLHGAMLGALDHFVERTNSEEIKPTEFRGALEGAKRGFADLNLTEAVKAFRAKKVMPKAQFDRLQAGMKRRAFTIARMTSQSLLELAHAELGRMLAEGFELREWTKFAEDRLVSAGWTPVNASHVQTIARTNIMGAHSSGRVIDMTQPEVLEARPYWQIRTVRDDRQRPSHGAVDGWVLRASDPFFQRCVYPAGYNCRCRLVSLSDRQFQNRGLVLRQGAQISGLPDPGFDAGGLSTILADFGG